MTLLLLHRLSVFFLFCNQFYSHLKGCTPRRFQCIIVENSSAYITAGKFPDIYRFLLILFSVAFSKPKKYVTILFLSLKTRPKKSESASASKPIRYCKRHKLQHSSIVYLTNILWFYLTFLAKQHICSSYFDHNNYCNKGTYLVHFKKSNKNKNALHLSKL